MSGTSRWRRQCGCCPVPVALALIMASVPVCANGQPSGEPAASSAAAPAEGLRALSPDEGLDLAIAEIVLRERQLLASEMLAYLTADGRLYLPFDELMAAVDFRLAADRNGRITGWFLRDNQSVDIDPASGSVRIAGRTLTLDAGDLVQIDGALHIAADALDRWFALAPAWDGERQRLVLTPAYLLPLEEAGLRQRGGLRRSGSETIDTTGFVPLSAPWRALGWPLLDANLSLTRQGSGTGVLAQGTVLAEGDLLWATGRLAVSANSQGIVDARLTLAQQDPQARLLGPLGASVIEAGDINIPSNPLLQRNNFGVGVRIGREPIAANGAFDAVDLIGDAPPGWQAELFRDSELLNFQTIATDGRYVFQQVPLAFGTNRFRIQLYGPSGERRTIDRTVDIADNLTRPGEWRYSVTGLRQGRSLFGGEPASGPGRLPGSFAATATYLEARTAYGISRNLGLSGFASWRKPDGGGTDIAYVGLGAVTRIADVLASVDGVLQPDGASAGRLSLATSFGRTSLSASHDAFSSGFISEDTSTDRGSISQRTQMALDTRIGGFGISLVASQFSRRDGSLNRNLTLRTSTTLAGFSLSHGLAWRDIRSGAVAVADQRLDGDLSVSGGIGPFRLRAALEYELQPQFRARRLRGEASYRRADWFVALSTDRNLADGTAQWGLAATRDWSGIRLGADLRYGEDRGEWQGFLTVALTIDRDPSGDGLRFGRAARSQRGTLLIDAFVDDNANGARDTGETSVEGFKVRVDPRGLLRGDRRTIAEDLPIDRAIAVEPLMEGIDNPYLIPVVPGLLVTARPAAPVAISFALVEGGEIEATLVGSGAAGAVVAP